MKRIIAIVLFLLFLSVTHPVCNITSAVAAADDWPYILLRGNLHVHTIYSNKTTSGEKFLDADHSLADLPDETVRQAKKIGLQVLGISDHNNVITPIQWGSILALADDSYSDSDLILLPGIEFTQGGLFSKNIGTFFQARQGEITHINFWGAKSFPDGERCPDFHAFYDWLRDQPDRYNIVCQFNHPNFGDSQFDKFKLQSDLADNFCLLEVGSGPTGFYEEVEDNLRWFNLALQNGWRVAPSIGIDNWGTIKKSDARRRHTGIWLELLDGLSQEGVLAALRARRVFASEDADAQLKFWAESGGKKAVMGEELVVAEGDEIKFLFDFRGKEKFHYNVAIVSQSGTSYHHGKEFLPSGFYRIGMRARSDTVCCFLYIKEENGDHIISAPIWLKAAPKKEPVGPDPTRTPTPSLPSPPPPRPQVPPKSSPPRPTLTMTGLPTAIPSNWNVEILAKGGREKSGPPSFFGEGSEVFVLEDGSQWRGETGFKGNKYLEMTQWLFHIRISGFIPPYDQKHSLKAVRYILTRKGWVVDNSHPQYSTLNFWDMQPTAFWNFIDVRTGQPNPRPVVYISEQNNSLYSPIGPGWYALAIYIDNLPVKVVRYNLAK